MDKISDSANSPQPPLPKSDGPHRKVKVVVAEAAGPQPPYIVAVVKKDKDAENLDAATGAGKSRAVYDPKELRAKARALLGNDRIPLEQRRVLKEILGPEEKG